MKRPRRTAALILTLALVTGVCLSGDVSRGMEPGSPATFDRLPTGPVATPPGLESSPIQPYETAFGILPPGETVPAPPPTATSPSYALRSMSELRLEARLPQTGELPADRAAERHLDAAAAPYSNYRPWMTYEYAWIASGLAHKPLYFEDVNLERYGNSVCPTLQPAISATRFLATVPLLPYLMTIDKPCECIYTLGYCRPGSKAANLGYRPPLQLNAAAVEAAAVTGFVFFVP